MTATQRAARMEDEVGQMIQIYGPACEKLGFKSDTDPWRDCILRLDTRDKLERFVREPSAGDCLGGRRFFQCIR
jgi:hypothetical protein